MRRLCRGSTALPASTRWATLDLGPDKILVALTLAFRRDSTTDMIEEAIREVTEALRKADERVVYVYVRPSDKAERPRRRKSEALTSTKQH